MEPRDFCYWLHGFFEIYPGGSLVCTPQLNWFQYRTILKHLSIVKIPENGLKDQFVWFCIDLKEKLKNWENIERFELPRELDKLFNNQPHYDLSTYPPGQYESLIKYVEFASC